MGSILLKNPLIYFFNNGKDIRIKIKDAINKVEFPYVHGKNLYISW